jgi:S-adenosylmethionine/arginine decarboxylase-like enzyme
MEPWGYHLMLDCSGAEHTAITNASTISTFAKELVKNIDMVAYGEPQVIHFGEGNKEGFTLVQLIQTSNICGHFCNDDNTMYLDVFSCKPFDKEVVKNTVVAYFGVTTMRELFTHRQA